MKKLKLTYFGSPDFSARFLDKLLTDDLLKNSIEVKLIVTQPDKPVGRKQIITKSPVKIVAEKFKIPVSDSQSLFRLNQDSLKQYYSLSKAEKNLEMFHVSRFTFHEFDLALLFAYGEIIPKNLLTLPKLGFWNIHPSLLPKYRGTSPIVFPLLMGDKKTGVTLIKMDEITDHGPIIAKQEIEINRTDRRPELEIKLTDLAFNLLKKKLLELNSTDFNQTQPVEQDHSQATYTRILVKNDGYIPFQTLKKAINNSSTSLSRAQQLSVEEAPNIVKEYYKKNILTPSRSTPTIQQFNNLTIYNLFRGLYPWPGLWTVISVKGHKKRLKITGLTINNQQLIINHVQLEGKKEVDFKTFNSAYSVF